MGVEVKTHKCHIKAIQVSSFAINLAHSVVTSTQLKATELEAVGSIPATKILIPPSLTRGRYHFHNSEIVAPSLSTQQVPSPIS